jgi:hypothetical protein
MNVQRIAVDGPHAAGPFQWGLHKGVHGTDLDSPAYIALHTFLLVNHCLLFAHADGPHGTPVDAAFTANTLVVINEHAFKTSSAYFCHRVARHCIYLQRNPMYPFEGSSSLPSIVPFSLLKPFFRPHFRYEVQVIVQVRVNSTETIKQAASGPVITLPATIEPLLLYTWPDLALRISSPLPTG